jgi:hypothetical protein
MLQVLVVISQSFVAEKRHVAIQKLLIKKEKRKELKKIEKCPRYPKQWVLSYLFEKKRRERKMNKIAHVLLKVVSKFQKREVCFQEAK